MSSSAPRSPNALARHHVLAQPELGLGVAALLVLASLVVVGRGAPVAATVTVLTVAVRFLAGLRCARQAAGREADRRGWAVLAAALIAAPVALAGLRLAPAVIPAAAALSGVERATWATLCAYPLLFVAVMVLARHHLPSLTRSAWLDGGISACTVAAFSTWLAAELPGSSPVSSLTAAAMVALPGLDLVLLAMVGALIRALKPGPGAAWTPLAVGLVIEIVANIAQFLSGVASLAVFAAVASIGGPLAALAMAAVAGRVRPPGGRDTTTPQGWLVLSGPIIFGAASLGLIGVEQMVAVPRSAVLLALVTLLLLGTRVGLSVRELAVLAETRRQARTDELTGLGNRRLFYEELRARTVHRQSGASFSVLRIDLDRFKAVNDALGHTIGDVVLQLVARRFAHLASGDEVLARLGGDEFGLIVTGSVAEVIERATHVRNSLIDPLQFDGLTLHVGVTVGVAHYPDHGLTEDEVMAAGDLALQRAKDAVSGLAVFDPSADTAHRDAMELTGQLRTGLAQGQLIAHYQPKVDLRSGRLLSMEALVRWQHPERGLLPPAVFLPLASSAGLLGALTDVMLRAATRDTAILHRLGLPVAVAVNVGSASLVDDGFPEQVSDALARAGLPAAALIIEITEDSVLLDPHRSLAMLDRLRALGVGLAIDDYGTGRASLAYLRDIPATELKLDQSFCVRILDDPKVAAMVRSTVQLGHALALTVVAEGIETPEIAAELTAMGCDVGQGYLYSRPVPIDALIERWTVTPSEAGPSTATGKVRSSLAG